MTTLFSNVRNFRIRYPANLAKLGLMLHLFKYKRNLFFSKFLLPHFVHLATFILAFFSLKVDYFFREQIKYNSP